MSKSKEEVEFYTAAREPACGVGPPFQLLTSDQSDISRMSSIGHASQIVLEGFQDFKGYSKLFAEDCHKNARNEGNIFEGGLGSSALLYLRCGTINPDPKRRHTLLRKAKMQAEACILSALQYRSKRVPRVTLMAGDFVGSKCLLAETLAKLGKYEEALEHARDVVATIEMECADKLQPSDCCLMYGKAGCLAAVHYLRQHLTDDTIGHNFVIKTSADILLDGRSHKSKDSSMLLAWRWHGRELLGAAFGTVGILYALLCNTTSEWNELEKTFPRARDVVRQTVDALEKHRFMSGNLRPSMDGAEGDHRCDWAHGSAGYIQLLLKAYEVFNDDVYLRRACFQGQFVLSAVEPKCKGVGVMRGVAGIGYAFLSLARADEVNRKVWLAKANEVGLSSIRDIQKYLASTRNSHSFGAGLAGLVTLLFDLAHPLRLPAPFIEITNNQRIGQMR